MLYMNNIQAICFGINDWSTDEARKFLKIHDITPIKKGHSWGNPTCGASLIKQNHFYDIGSFSQIIINMFIVLKLFRKNR